MSAERCRVLVVECDPDRLHAQGINLGDEFSKVTQACPDARLHRIEARTRRDFRRMLEGLNDYYDIVVLVGHANVEVLGFSNGEAATWAEVGEWLDAVEPETILAAGCEAGRTLATRHLFEKLGDLQEVFGVGGAATADQIRVLGLILRILITSPDVDSEILHLIQVIHAAVKGVMVFHQTREGYEGSSEGQDVVWDTGERLLQDLLRKLFQR